MHLGRLRPIAVIRLVEGSLVQGPPGVEDHDSAQNQEEQEVDNAGEEQVRHRAGGRNSIGDGLITVDQPWIASQLGHQPATGRRSEGGEGKDAHNPELPARGEERVLLLTCEPEHQCRYQGKGEPDPDHQAEDPE